MHVNDSLKWWPTLTINKYEPDTVSRVSASLGRQALGADLAGMVPDSVVVCEGNELTTAGLQRIAEAIVGDASQVLDDTHTALGVGNSSTAFSAAHTDLQGASKRFEAVTSTSSTGSVISTQATFEADDGNFAWEEWCLVITDAAAADGTAKPTGVMLNRRVQSLGIKASGAVWTLSVSVTLS